MKGEKFSNKSIAELLRNVASAYLLKNENRFKIIAYENAATTVEHLTRELKDIWQEGKLREVPTIGANIASHLEEFFEKGKSKYFEEILVDIPPSVFTMMRVPGIGPKTAYKLTKEFNLLDPKTILKDIKQKAKVNKIAILETFGEKSQQEILESIERYEKHKDKEERMPLPYADALAKKIIGYLKLHKAVKRVDALGSLRRKVATIGDIDLAAVVDEKHSQEVIDHFLRYSGKTAIDNSGEKKASIIVSPNIRVDLRVQDERTYGSMLQYFTGGKAHNINLREFALKKGLSLNEYGIKEVKSQKLKVKNESYRHPEESRPNSRGRSEDLVKDENESGSQIGVRDDIKTFKTEEEFYNFLGLQYIPPEIREGTNEIPLALKNKIPQLIEVKDIKGDFHIHSSYDLKPSHDFGVNTYLEIAQKGYQLGYEYVGFADHNPKFTETPEQEIIDIMKKRKEYIEEVFATNPEKRNNYFIGLETDILPDGSIALPEKAIEYVDYLIVSIHSSFGLNLKTMTKRVLQALSYPKVKILGHPTGRLLGKREGYELDWLQIFDMVTKKNIAIEINSSPQRLDLPDSLVREGLQQGVEYVINTDSHALAHMDNMFYGVSVARRGWLQKKDVVNTRSYHELKKWVK